MFHCLAIHATRIPWHVSGCAVKTDRNSRISTFNMYTQKVCICGLTQHMVDILVKTLIPVCPNSSKTMITHYEGCTVCVLTSQW